MGDQSGKDINELCRLAKSGDLRAFARLLTRIERRGPKILGDLPELMTPEKPTFRFGITGPPGAGKSTLIGRLIGEMRKLNLRVGVMAVDPSSPFSKGAILGDRIRYHEHFNDENVFIRSLGSRGSLGGLSASAYLMVRAFDLAPFDVVLLETVGVGQSELEIMNVADQVAVTLVPESGDSIQGMKAGLLEIADLFIVNKGDRPGADIFIRELQASLHLDPRAPSKGIPILKTSALNGDGLDKLSGLIIDELKNVSKWSKKRVSQDRLQAEARSLLRHEAERRIENQTQQIVSTRDFISVLTQQKN